MATASSSVTPKFDGVDDNSNDFLRLFATMSLQDLDDIQKTRKGKAIQGTALTDEEFAFQLYAEEANELLTFANDAILARSIDEALQTDRTVIQQMIAVENAALRDRQYALAVEQGCAPPPSTSPSDAAETTFFAPDPTTLRSVGRPALSVNHTSIPVVTLFPSANDDDKELNATIAVSSTNRTGGMGSSGWRKTVPETNRNECIICMEEIRRVEIRAPCGHYYDLKCLTDLFRSTLTDESLFPPRCCQRPFIFDNIRQHFNQDLVVSFEKKSAEFSVVNRVYCHEATCSAFLGAATEHATPMSCSECLSNTCGHCKECAHGVSPCAAKHDAAILTLAEQEGWKRCPGCHRLVELTVGCYHMTCICKKQFCYVCTETWKNCDCPQWEENRLLSAATERVNRQIRQEPEVRAARNFTFAQLVVQETERLRVNHHCEHRYWQYRGGAGHCEWCGHYLGQFLLRCRGCETLACVRCRRNRV